MPDAQVAVYYKETGEMQLMHSVDATEAVSSGAYAAEAPVKKEALPAAQPVGTGRK